MTTFAPAPLKNLIEPTARKPLEGDGSNPDSEARVRRPRHLYISPALYTTPKPTPFPEYSSPEPAFTSPYVLNQKLRRGGDERVGGDISVVSDMPTDDEGFVSSLKEEVVRDSGNEELNENDEYDCDSNDFRYVDSDRQIDSDYVSTQGDFLDANEEFSEDGSGFASPSSSTSKLEAVLHSTRLSILEEIDRRKTAEETMSLMQSQWRRIRCLFSEVGLAFPAPTSSNSIMEFDHTSTDQLLQELVFSKFVSEAIGRGVARAEAEEDIASIIMSKDQEMQRLRDRLQYFETVNHEMSQRKLVEIARKQHEKKKNRRRWMWSLMGFSVAAGASFLAYAYYKSPSAESIHLTDSSSDSPSQQWKR